MGQRKMRRMNSRAWSLSAHLLVLCLAILVPAIGLGGLALLRLFAVERASTEQRILQAVEDIASGVDREILGFTRVGESLAASPLLQSQDFEKFDLHARHFLGLQGWFVILTDRNGQQIVNTTLPAGSPLPKVDPARVRDVIESGKPRISDLFYSETKSPLVGVRVPVIAAGQAAYVLTVAVPAEVLTPLLDQSFGGLSWTVEIADRSGRVIARSDRHAESVGKMLSQAALTQLRWNKRLDRGSAEDQTSVLRAIDRSALAGWVVAATVPGSELARISRQGWAAFSLLAALLCGLSVALAYLFARRIAEPIEHLARIPAEGRKESFPDTGLAEANWVGAALIDSIRELEASEERYRTLVEAANDIIYTLDLDGHFLTCNAAGRRALGYAAEELIGQPLSSLVIGGDRHRITDQLSSAGKHDPPFEIEVRARSGQPLIWEVSSRLLRGADGRPESVLSIARDITERRRAESTLRANEERLRLALAGVGAGVWEYDFATRSSSWSPEMLDLYGLKGRTQPPSRVELLSLVHPDDRERIRRASDEQVEKGGPFAAEYRIIRPDGQLAWISSRGVVEVGPDGRAVRARGIDQDVTAAKNAEAQRENLLRTTAQQLNELRALYNSAPIGLALLDREFRFQRINSVLAEGTGFPVEEHLGKVVWDLVPDFRPIAEPLLQQVLETGEPLTGVEITGETPAQPGVQRTWLLQVYPIRSRDGSVIGIGIICEEVTERQRALLNQAHLAALVESSTDAIISYSMDGRIRSWNPGAERMFGYTAAEAIGKGTDLLIPPGSTDRPSALFERVKAGESPTIETRRRRKDGTEIEVAISASPVRDSSGRLVAVSVTFRDISEQKRREEHTRFIMRELSHRSKNLLAVIQAMARQTARTSRDLADFQERFTARVRGLAQSHDLLVKREWRGVPVAELVRAQVAPFVDRSEQGLVLSGPSLSLKPEAAQNIGLALHELATNASKHGALSRPTGQIEVRWGLEKRDGERRFRMFWRESGGPKVVEPSQRGFGHTVVESVIGRALEGEAHLEWQPDGLIWQLDVSAGCLAPEANPLAAAELVPDDMAEELQALLRRWLTLRQDGGLPPLSTIDLASMPEADRVFIVAVEHGSGGAVRFNYLHVGEKLAALFGRPHEGEPIRKGGEQVIGALEGCYGLAAATRQPCYDWARTSLDDHPLEYERLLLPFADGDGVSHILGLVAFIKGA